MKKEPSEKIEVLYVDDGNIQLELFYWTFMKKFDVYTTDSGEEGLMMLDIMPDIDIIISDFNMPVVNGLEFIARAKEKKENLSCYILSGTSKFELIKGAINCKLIDGFFQKPMDKEEILDELMKHSTKLICV